MKEGAHFKVGGDFLHEADFLATGFLAIPRTVLQKTIEKMSRKFSIALPATYRVYECAEEQFGGVPYFSLFQPFPAKDKMSPIGMSYLSEDWAFSARVKAAGYSLYVYEKPFLAHTGKFAYHVVHGVPPQLAEAAKTQAMV